ncbi:MAG TPA: dihydrolipoamide acetyltransferase family protein [Candidatus Angelobacter sp.]
MQQSRGIPGFLNIMAISIVMPALELAQENGTVVSWQKKEGERVVKGEPLLEVETDKALVEIESPGDGVLGGVKARAGDVIAVGTVIGWILNPGEAVPAGPPELVPSGRDGSRQQTRKIPRAVDGAEERIALRPRISPKARQLAREHHVNIVELRGSGPGGEILASDILEEARAQSGIAATNFEKLSAVGKLMAERTTQSWTSVPHFFVTRELDASALVKERERLTQTLEQARGVRPTYTDLLIALSARVLVQHPRMYASWAGEGVRLNPEVNIGVAIAVKDGVVSAVIHGAAGLDVGEIALRQKHVTEQARLGRLRPADITGATFTISNLGMYGVDAFSAIIQPPQAAILAVGRIADRVVAVDGRPVVRPFTTLTLSCDHRVVDGARAGAFLHDLSQAILEPEKWLQ